MRKLRPQPERWRFRSEGWNGIAIVRHGLSLLVRSISSGLEPTPGSMKGALPRLDSRIWVISTSGRCAGARFV
jgi:hypothetical protein